MPQEDIREGLLQEEGRYEIQPRARDSTHHYQPDHGLPAEHLVAVDDGDSRRVQRP